MIVRLQHHAQYDQPSGKTDFSSSNNNNNNNNSSSGYGSNDGPTAMSASQNGSQFRCRDR